MSILTSIIKSDYVRAQILAFARHTVTALGVSLVAKGYADDGTVTALAGLVTAGLGFYLSQLDVKNVDTKIQTALATPVPEQSVTVSQTTTEPPKQVTTIVEIGKTPSGSLTLEEEKEETRLLNSAHINK